MTVAFTEEAAVSGTGPPYTYTDIKTRIKLTFWFSKKPDHTHLASGPSVP
jgi:hypothetical protein